MYGDALQAAKAELSEMRHETLVDRLLSNRQEALNLERKVDEWSEKHDKAVAIIKAACAVLSTVLPSSSDLLELCEAARVVIKDKRDEVPF